jgi:hypothetical protein
MSQEWKLPGEISNALALTTSAGSTTGAQTGTGAAARGLRLLCLLLVGHGVIVRIAMDKETTEIEPQKIRRITQRDVRGVVEIMELLWKN